MFVKEVKKNPIHLVKSSFKHWLRTKYDTSSLFTSTTKGA